MWRAYYNISGYAVGRVYLYSVGSSDESGSPAHNADRILDGSCGITAIFYEEW